MKLLEQFIKKELLQHINSFDAYATKAFYATITGPELCLYKEKQEKIKELLLKRLEESYSTIRKEIEEA